MGDVYLVEALRTPFGAFGGALAEVGASQLAATVIKGLMAKTGLAGETVNEVIIGQVLSGGCGQAPARQALRLAGLPDAVHAMTINKVCGSGLKAIMLGADSIMLGNSRVVIAGGMENMSTAPYFLKKARSGYRMGHGEIFDLMVHDGLQDPYSGRLMGEIGEASAARHDLSRAELDMYALRSYRLALGAVQQGIFEEEILKVVKQGKNGEETVRVDEEPFKMDLELLPGLRPVFRKDGVITAGNASTISDGAALALLTDEAGLKGFNLKPKARIVAAASESRDPDHFPEAPEGAIRKACVKAGIPLEAIDLFEINEAFASVPLTVARQLHIDLDRINVNGGAVAIGHPIGASGGRLAATLIRELHRRKVRYGLATLCIGGGEAVALIFERV
ncbi:MAG: thiolase family protein [Geobacteraceae bacterium]|jgi:acetyl-CoA C-acetyltransferase